MNLLDRITSVDTKRPSATEQPADVQPSLKQSIFTEVPPASPVSDLIEQIEEQAVANESLLLQLQQRLSPLLLPASDAAAFSPDEDAKGTVARLEELAKYAAHQGHIISRILVRIDL